MSCMEKTKKITLLGIFLIIFLFTGKKRVLASQAYPYTITITQEDGSKYSAYLRGNEGFHYYIDKNGFVIAKDPSDSVWKYVISNKKQLSFGNRFEDQLNNANTDSMIGDKDLKAEQLKKELYALIGGEPGLINTETYDDYSKILDVSKTPQKKILPTAKKVSEMNTIPMITIVVEYSDVDYVNDVDWSEKIYTGDNSISGYYSEVSNGRFTFTSAHETSQYNEGGNTNQYDKQNDGVIHVTINRKHGNWGSPDTQSKIKDMCQAMKTALEESSTYIDFSSFDKNNDSYISNDELAVLFIMAGYEAAVGSGNSPEIWAHSYNLSYGISEGCKIDGVELDSYITMGEKLDGSNEIPTINSIGTVCHELGHFLGLPDLYDTGYSAGKWSSYNVYMLSLMAQGNWAYESSEEGDVYIPAHMDPYSKIACGFITPENITESGTYTVDSIGSENGYNTYKIATDDINDYFLIENRQYEKYDRGIKSGYQFGNGKSGNNNSGGIVVWHVDLDDFEANSETNTVNDTTHKPAIMPVFPESIKDNFYLYPFWNSDRISQLSKYGRGTVIDCQHYTDTPGQYISTGIQITCTDASSNEMSIQVVLPDGLKQKNENETNQLPGTRETVDEPNEKETTEANSDTKETTSEPKIEETTSNNQTTQETTSNPNNYNKGEQQTVDDDDWLLGSLFGGGDCGYYGDGFGCNGDNWGCNRDNWGFNRDNWGCNRDNWGFDRDNWGFIRDDWGFNGDDWGFNGDDWGFNEDDWGFNGDDWGFNGDDWGFNGDDWRFNGDDRGCDEENNRNQQTDEYCSQYGGDNSRNDNNIDSKNNETESTSQIVVDNQTNSADTYNETCSQENQSETNQSKTNETTSQIVVDNETKKNNQTQNDANKSTINNNNNNNNAGTKNNDQQTTVAPEENTNNQKTEADNQQNNSETTLSKEKATKKTINITTEAEIETEKGKKKDIYSKALTGDNLNLAIYGVIGVTVLFILFITFKKKSYDD